MPKKTIVKPRGPKRQNKRRQQNVALKSENVDLLTVKHRKGDARMGANGTRLSVALPSQSQAITMVCPMEEQDIWFFSLGFVTRALEKGYQASATADYYPYFAYVFCQSVIKALSTGGTSPLTRVPYMILAIGRALSQKRVGFSNGYISYTHTLTTDTEPDITQNLGDTGNIYQWNIGWPTTSTLVNGWPTTATSFPSYTPEEGILAFQELVQYLSNTLGSAYSGSLRYVDVSSKTQLDSDCSTYSFIIKNTGEGAGGVGHGGVCAFVAAEVPIFKPLFSVFASSTTDRNKFQRFENFGVSASGDPIMLGAGMVTFLREQDWSARRFPKLHPVDFNEFGDVLCRFLAEAISTLISDQTNNEGVNPNIFLCPLTLQELLLVLRNTMMDMFQDTQAAVQSIYPRVPTTSSTPDFVPYIASASTCFKQTSAIKLPMPFVENMRALQARYVQRSPTDVEWFIPILGEYQDSALVWSDYRYQVLGDVVSYPVFPDPSTVFQKREWDDKSSTFVYRPFVETAISLVDGKGGGQFVQINDSAQLQNKAMLFNDWITTTGLATYTSAFVTATPEPGINILSSVTTTRQWNVVLQDEKKPEVPDKFLDLRTKKSSYQRLVGTPYDLRQALADQSQSSIISAAYENFLGTWILPVSRLVINDGPNSTFATRIEALNAEPYVSTIVNSTTGKRMSEMHQNYAQKMLKGRTAQSSDWDNLLVEMAAQGRGGILSGLVGAFADMVSPGAGGVVRSIGGAIGL